MIMNICMEKCLMFVSFAADADENVALTEVAPLLQNLSKDLTECYNHFVEAALLIFKKDDFQKLNYFSNSLSNEILRELHNFSKMDDKKRYFELSSFWVQNIVGISEMIKLFLKSYFM